VARCTKLTDAAVVALAALPLRSLDLSLDTLLTEAALDVLETARTPLRSLSIQGLHLIKNHRLSAFIEASSQLRTLNALNTGCTAEQLVSLEKTYGRVKFAAVGKPVTNAAAPPAPTQPAP